MAAAAAPNFPPNASLETASFSDLVKYAAVERNDSLSIKKWLSLARKSLLLAQQFDESKDLRQAYVYYTRTCSIIAERIPQHKDFAHFLSTPTPDQAEYLKFKKHVMTSILPTVEEIVSDIKSSIATGSQSSESLRISDASSILPMSSQSSLSSGPTLVSNGSDHHAKPLPSAGGLPGTINTMSDYPSRQGETSFIPLPTLPSAPTHAPTYQPKRQSIEQMSPKRPLPPPPPIIPPNNVASPPAPPKLPLSPAGSQSPHPRPNMLPRSASSRPLPSISTTGTTINPEELLEFLSHAQAPSILLLDIRNPESYRQGHIRHNAIINIDPLSLRPNISALDIESSLVLLPDNDQAMFYNRNRYEFVVYYDDSSYGSRWTGSQGWPALDNLVSALWNSDFNRRVKRMPLLLVGGFQAWEVLAGQKWIITQGSSEAQPQHGLKEKRDSGGDIMNKLLVNQHHDDQQFVDNITGRSRASFSELSPAEQAEYHKKLKRRVALHPGKPVQQQYARNLMDLFQQQQPIQSMTGSSYSMPNTPYSSYGSAAHGLATPPVARQKPGGNGYFPYPSNHLDAKPGAAADSTSPPLVRRRTYVDHPFSGFSEVQHPDYQPPQVSRKNTGDSPVTPPVAAAARAPNRPLPHPPSPYDRSGAVTSEKMFSHPGRLPSFASDHSHSAILSNGLTGLKNLGNTCYMNSVLQCLSGTSPLARYFLDGSWQRHNRTDNRKGTFGTLPPAFHQLLKVMWSGTYKFVSPVTLRDKIGKFSADFRTDDQQDAHDFQVWFLDKLHEDLNTIAPNAPKPPTLTTAQEDALERIPQQIAADWAWERHSRTDWSIISHLFQGLYQNRLQCLKCGRTSTTYSPFMSVSLPIHAIRNKSTTLEQCLEAFFRQEILEKDEAWNCPGCRSRQKASKQMKIAKLPLVLCLHLKRFSHSGHFKDKLETMVQFPTQDLNLTNYTPPPLPPTAGPITSNPDVAHALQVLGVPPDRVPKGSSSANNVNGDKSGSGPPYLFDLYGVVNHFGSLSSGHYTANVRSRGDWNNFDDSNLKTIQSSYVVSKDAYMLYYVRQSVV